MILLDNAAAGSQRQCLRVGDYVHETVLLVVIAR